MKRELKALIGQMTLEEKASLCSGSEFWHTQGSERLGIPAVMVTDGPHGLRKQAGEADHLGLNDSVEAVCFPAGCATGSSFDPDLLEHMGQVLGDECQAEDVSILLGPAVNIKRSPLCGRNFAMFSEDPHLTAALAAAVVGGAQNAVVGPLLGLPAGFSAAVGLVCVFCGATNTLVASIVLAAELFSGAGFELMALACGLSYMFSGYHSLYSSQGFRTSKLFSEFLQPKEEK